MARIEACRTEPPGTCVTTDLTVTVIGTGRRPLARAGLPVTATEWITLATLSAVAGLVMLALGAPWSARWA
jgi:hypothetical protein